MRSHDESRKCPKIILYYVIGGCFSHGGECVCPLDMKE